MRKIEWSYSRNGSVAYWANGTTSIYERDICDEIKSLIARAAREDSRDNPRGVILVLSEESPKYKLLKKKLGGQKGEGR